MTDSDDEIFEAEMAAELLTIRALTRSEEDELVRVATSNSAEAEQALRELERSSIRLVLSIARNETNGRPLRHCYRLGRQGWTNALAQFDHKSGFKFSTYATWHIRKSTQETTITRKNRL